MSADSWDTCPRCARRYAQLMTTKSRQLEQGYGSMPQKEWLELKEEVDSPHNLDDSLREYHEQGLVPKNGEWKYYSRYHGTCTNAGCGFEYETRSEVSIEEIVGT